MRSSGQQLLTEELAPIDNDFILGVASMAMELRIVVSV
jgi:hypothetical protein